jgi:hypothetical protein
LQEVHVPISKHVSKPVGKSASKPANKDDRLFNQQGRRAYRKRYSLTEVRIGALIVLLLAAIAVWVAWRGRNPDPSLFEISLESLDAGAAPVERGPLPADLALPGWHESGIAAFDASNLYEKIDGREGYYKSLGFQGLHFVSIVSDANAATVVDIELFDQGTAANALGAYAGERPPDAIPIGDDGKSVIARNALFMTRGKYYVRAIGSDESEPVVAMLRHVQQRFAASLQDESLPWGYAVFAGALGFDAGRVSYMPEDAFSFGFARNVYAARLDDDATELFLTVAADDAAAAALADQFTQGFLSYGSAAGESGGVAWVKDRYLGGMSGARAQGSWVLGVRGAPDPATAEQGMTRLAAAVRDLPAEVAAEARQSAVGPAAEPTSAEESYQ